MLLGLIEVYCDKTVVFMLSDYFKHQWLIIIAGMGILVYIRGLIKVSTNFLFLNDKTFKMSFQKETDNIQEVEKLQFTVYP